MVGRRHDHTEIAAKLSEARELAAKGSTQQEIARALGVSVMTYHRWRKLPIERPQLASAGAEIEQETPSRHCNRLADLQLENSRLRRLVTDLLLEKIALEEDIKERRNNPARHVS